jgi:hypothetical protein
MGLLWQQWRAALATLFALAALVLGPEFASARGTLDQSVTAVDNPAYIVGASNGSNYAEAQTFTAGVSGFLDTVALPLYSVTSHSRYLLTLQGATVGGNPDGVVLASALIDACSIPNSLTDLRDTVFSPAPAVTAGHRYALVLALDPTDPLGPTDIIWYSGLGPYAGGGRSFQDTTAAQAAWQQQGLFGFRTYVSGAQPATAIRDATTLDLSAAPNPGLTGQDVAVTARVSVPGHVDRIPAGILTFFIDGGQPPAVALDARGQATYVFQPQFDGHHQIAAAYCPSSTAFVSSEQTAAVDSMARYPATVHLMIVPDPTVVGENARFTATVTGEAPSGPAPTGTVQFKEDNGTPIGAPVPLDSQGAAALDTVAHAGAYRVHAAYVGDPRFAAAEATADQTVERADTRTTVTATPNPVQPGDELTIGVDVAVLPPGDADLDGAIQMTLNGQPVGQPIGGLQGFTGVIITANDLTTPGTGVIGARYLGGPDTNPSEGSVTETVTAPVASSSAAAPSPAASGPAARPPSAAPALKGMAIGLRTALRRGGLRALRTVTEKFVAPEPGKLQQRITATATPGRARHAEARVTTVAVLSRTVTAAGTVKIKPKLTAAGTRLIRRGANLRLSVITSFTRAGGPPERAVVTLTVAGRRGARRAVVFGALRFGLRDAMDALSTQRGPG